jgi:CRISPR system Cascade subunit CasE
MAFPSRERVEADAAFLQPFDLGDFAKGHVHVTRDHRAGFLFRVDPLPGGRAAVLVQSSLKPDWDYAFGNAAHLLAAPPQVRTWEPSFAIGEALRFRLLANTVKRVSLKDPDRDGPRVPVASTREAMTDWLQSRAGRCGFLVSSLDTLEPGWTHWSKDLASESGIRIRTVLFEGALQVQDKAAFVGAVASGIGPSKAYGCGLLSLAR